MRLSQQRAEWLGARLREQVEADGGTGGLVGDQLAVDANGCVVRVSEYARTLGELEARERATVANFAERVARLGLDLADRSAAMPMPTAVAWLEAFAAEAGLDWGDDATRQMAQRAVLRVRERSEGTVGA